MLQFYCYKWTAHLKRAYGGYNMYESCKPIFHPPAFRNYFICLPLEIISLFLYIYFLNVIWFHKFSLNHSINYRCRFLPSSFSLKSYDKLSEFLFVFFFAFSFWSEAMWCTIDNIYCCHVFFFGVSETETKDYLYLIRFRSHPCLYESVHCTLKIHSLLGPQ